MRCSLRFFPVFLLLFGLMGAHPVQAYDVFTFFEVGMTPETIEPLAASREIDGIALHFSWADMEPEKNLYNWKELDAYLAVIGKHRKKLTLNIVTRGALEIPRWVQDTPDKMYLEDGVSTIIPWSKEYTNAYMNFVESLSRHIQEIGYAANVRYVGHGMSGLAPTGLYGCNSGYLDTVAFDYTAYHEEFAARMRALMAAFPYATVIMEIPPEDVCGGDGNGARFVEDVQKNLGPLAANLMLVAPDLNAISSRRLSKMGISLNQGKVGGRFVWSYETDKKNRFGGTFRETACLSRRGYNVTYFEVFPNDFHDDNHDIIKPIRALRRGDDAMLCNPVQSRGERSIIK